MVARSLNKWRRSREYKQGLAEVKAWRVKHDETSVSEGPGSEEAKAEEADARFAEALSQIKRKYKKTYVTQHTETAPRDTAKDASPTSDNPYSLERDVKVHILQFEPIPTGRSGTPSTGADDDCDAELDGLMRPYQEQGGLLHKEVYKEQFPNQVISVENFLAHEFKQMAPNGGRRDGDGDEDASDDPGGGSDPETVQAAGMRSRSD